MKDFIILGVLYALLLAFAYYLHPIAFLHSLLVGLFGFAFTYLIGNGFKD